MKRFLFTVMVAIGLAQLRAYAETPCANLYIYDATVGHRSPADIFVKNGIEERVKTKDGLCFKGYVDSGSEWQVQSHQKSDMLLAYTLGMLTDYQHAPGMIDDKTIEVGKTIDIVTYDVYAWNGKVNRIVNTGTFVLWFPVSQDTLSLQMWAKSAANHVVDVISGLALMYPDGGQAK